MSAPVACVTPFDTEEEAVTLATAIAGAPAAYPWTSDPRHGSIVGTLRRPGSPGAYTISVRPPESHGIS